MALKSPIVCGRTLVLSGDLEDLYFQLFADAEPFDDGVVGFLDAITTEDAVVVDVGANIGVHALTLASKAPRGLVHTFEPNPRTAEHLRRNIEMNHIGNITMHPQALAATKGTLSLYDNRGFAAGSFITDHAASMMRGSLAEEVFLQVESITLDEFAAAQGLERLELVKVDAEGFDLDVVRGGLHTLANFRPCVALEFATYAITMHSAMLPASVLTELRALFDHVFVIEPDGAPLREITTDRNAVDFLYQNATSRPVQDLFCAFDGSPLLAAALQYGQG